MTALPGTRAALGELEFQDVAVTYGRGPTAMTAVSGVDLVVPAGQVVGLVGESGSGKSTLARAAVGLAPTSRGRIRLDGSDLRTRRDRRRIQMVLQDPQSAFDPRITIGGALGEALRGSPAGQRRAETIRLLELVQLDPALASRYPRELSGGQRQRAALARALAARPDVLIADEITSALDVSVQGAVVNVLKSVQRELGLTVLFISHNLAVVRYVSDLIAVMYMGQVVEQATPEDLISAPHHPYTEFLLSAVPSPLGRAGAKGLVTEGLDPDPPDPHHPPTGCRFHPRCPVGPLVLPERAVCRTDDPTAGSTDRPHHSACHFAEEFSR